MPAIYVLNTLDNRRAAPEGFDSKKAAKELRNKLIAEGTTCVVSRGPDHPFGASRVDPYCLTKERTSRKRRKIKSAVEATLEELKKIR